MTYKTKKDRHVNIFYDFFRNFLKISYYYNGMRFTCFIAARGFRCRGGLNKPANIFGYLIYVPPAQGGV